ncbi:hypothetical protein ThrDRAFT_04243 [Frankia casuarinae]|uniref:CorA-like Mg2+ transporter protein n=1 Tax=Frankia casuarinae (strain DSM 45818 / CECT 9043 / HFP020203 / CcI3) TaxID=106370 RepID=Q2JE95_FRACC|nr:MULTISPECIES: hypothetical protein [Frankia]ABD10397.1 hypothetical protein Francci3_1014 [Frankia casuarinae]EYT90144.1 hypothetical protein ThrDRAFT_04243 [Frankia casuarinae]KDA41401.1 hypothetical protein BMG523Draft_03775 [Frankia sp. BMG5.23]TFE30186.1 hypothetical protein E0F15_12430 [Frankia sp. B2]
MVVCPAFLTGTPDWPEGPLPLRHKEIEATTAARSTYFSAACARILYGTPDRPSRWQRTAPTGETDSPIFGTEILLPDPDRPDRAFVIVHVHIQAGGSELLDVLRAVAGRRGSATPPPDLGSALPTWARLAPSARRFTIAFLTFPTLPEADPPRPVDAARIDSWSTADTWLWHLASRTANADYPPDPDHADQLLDGRVILSADWRGLVTRDGAAFLGLRPDDGADDAFFGFAQLYAHTTYLDAVLIGMIQNVAITEMIAEAARAFEAQDLTRHLARLEERAARFRNIYWLRDASAHGPANDILTAYQAQHHLPERFDAVLTEIVDLNRIAQTQEGQQVGAALGVITVVGLPFGAAFAVLQVLGVNSARDLLIGVLAALAGSGALLLTRFGRLLLRSLR